MSSYHHFFFQILYNSQILDKQKRQAPITSWTASGAHLMEISRLEGLTTTLYAEANFVPSEFRAESDDVYCVHAYIWYI